MTSSSTFLKFIDTPIDRTNLTLVFDISAGVSRSYVPKDFHHAVFELIHSLAYPGIQATQHLLTASYVWPSINTDIRKWTHSCGHCQKSKIQQHTVTPLSAFTKPDLRFDYVHIYFVGLLPLSNVACTYLLVSIHSLVGQKLS